MAPAEKDRNNDPLQLIALAAAVLIIIAVAASVVLKPPASPQATLAPTPKASATASVAVPSPSVFASQQKYDYSKYLLSSKRETRAPDENGYSQDEETLTNEGPEAARFGVAEVFPNAGINDVEITAPPENDAARLSATRHLDANPLMQLTDFELAPDESVSLAAHSQKNLFDAAPVRLLTDAGLTAFQRLKLAPVLAKIAELALPLQQARAFERAVNKAFAQTTEQENAFEDYVDAVEEFVDEVHDEIVAAERAKPTPRPTPRIAEMQFPIPTPPTPPTQTQMENDVFPKLPESVKLEVDENNPYDEKLFYVQPTLYLGELIYKKEGDAAQYLTVSTERIDYNYLMTVKANVKKAIKDDKIPFDLKTGAVAISFSLAPNQVKKVSIEIKVEHVEPSEDVQADADETSETGDATETTLSDDQKLTPEESSRLSENLGDVTKNYNDALKAQLPPWLTIKQKVPYNTGNGDTQTIEETHPAVLRAYEALCTKMGVKPYGKLGQAGHVNSGYRDANNPAELKKLENGGSNNGGPHRRAMALDISVGGLQEQIEWVQAAQGIFTRGGIYCGQGFIHLDLMPRGFGARYWIQRGSQKNYQWSDENAFGSLIADARTTCS